MIFSFSEKLLFALLFSLYLHVGCHIPPDRGTQVPGQFVSCPLPRVGHWAEIPWSIPLLSLSGGWIRPNCWTPISEGIPGSLAQIFLDPYSKHVEDSLVNFSCFFFGGRIRPDGGRRVPEQLPGTSFPRPKPTWRRFTAQAQCTLQNLKRRKPQEPGKVETAWEWAMFLQIRCGRLE